MDNSKQNNNSLNELYTKEKADSSAMQEKNYKIKSETISNNQDSAKDSVTKENLSVGLDEKEALISLENEYNSDIGVLFIAYGILFFIVIVFMPQIYLANNIYYASKDINYLKTQKEALKDENAELQQKLESLKFNFLTLEIDEINKDDNSKAKVK